MKQPEFPLQDLYRRGLDALHRELGPVGMIRFLQQVEAGHGDYTKERGRWLGDLPAEDVKTGIQQAQEAMPKRRRKPRQRPLR